jgi:hypothetical protein
MSSAVESPASYAETPYGFTFGQAEVERMSSDKAAGWVIITVRTHSTELLLYVQQNGSIMVMDSQEGDKLRLYQAQTA